MGPALMMAMNHTTLAHAYLTGRDASGNRAVREMGHALAGLALSWYHAPHPGLRIEPVDFDPYPAYEALAADVRQGRMLVYAGGSPSPLWDQRANIAFRAWHDVAHHVTPGVGFDLTGEHLAFRAAASQHPGLAPLLWSEVVLQAAAFAHLGTFPATQRVVVSGQGLCQSSRLPGVEGA